MAWMALARLSSADCRRMIWSSLLLELLLVEQLAARHAVDLRAQLGDAILVGELHFGLARDQPGQHVVAEREIGRGDDGPARHDHQRADHDPEGDRAEADLAAGMGQRVAGARRRDGGGLRPGSGGMPILNAGIWLRRNLAVGHRRFPAGDGGPKTPALLRQFKPGMVNFFGTSCGKVFPWLARC